MQDKDDPCLKNEEATHLIVQEDPNDGRQHAQDVCEGDWVAQHYQGDGDNHDPLGGVGDGVAEWADQIENTEGNDVLREVAEATDEQEDKSTRPC